MVLKVRNFVIFLCNFCKIQQVYSANRRDHRYITCEQCLYADPAARPSLCPSVRPPVRPSARPSQPCYVCASENSLHISHHCSGGIRCAQCNFSGGMRDAHNAIFARSREGRVLIRHKVEETRVCLLEPLMRPNDLTGSFL